MRFETLNIGQLGKSSNVIGPYISIENCFMPIYTHRPYSCQILYKIRYSEIIMQFVSISKVFAKCGDVRFDQ